MRNYLCWKEPTIAPANPGSDRNMDAETLTALKSSIKHWEDIVAEESNSPVHGMNSCALCKRFNPNCSGSINYVAMVDRIRIKAYGCPGCPVQEKTGYSLCDGSPYEDFSNADANESLSRKDRCDLLHIHAQSELDFLRSL